MQGRCARPKSGAISRPPPGRNSKIRLWAGIAAHSTIADSAVHWSSLIPERAVGACCGPLVRERHITPQTSHPFRLKTTAGFNPIRSGTPMTKSPLAAATKDASQSPPSNATAMACIFQSRLILLCQIEATPSCPAGSGHPVPWMASFDPSVGSGFRQSPPK